MFLLFGVQYIKELSWAIAYYMCIHVHVYTCKYNTLISTLKQSGTMPCSGVVVHQSDNVYDAQSSSGTPEMHVGVLDRVEKLAACFVYIKTERYEAVFLHCNLIPIV